MSLFFLFGGAGNITVQASTAQNLFVVPRRVRRFVVWGGRSMSRRLGHVYQDKDEGVAYTFDWTHDLNGSTVSSVEWSVPSGISTESTSNTTTTGSIRLAGGTPGRTYKIEGKATTALNERSQAHILVTIGN